MAEHAADEPEPVVSPAARLTYSYHPDHPRKAFEIWLSSPSRLS